ncbi:HD domain-containing phosphohydrolase [Anaerolinea thermophila]|uniref:Signaling protein n=2 Tax=Anaerolinea TaxID=233189 RepID=E8MY95_ANATU|nr:HD domain-containing phosphohydrolase [Anaerolinea thermophila]BAJ62040.1 putative signaling protein [Anaerolinea thermophila UNI-1]
MKLPVHFQKEALRISGLYLLFAGLWILFSDRLLEWLVPNPHRLALFQTYKGWGFVLITALLLYLTLRARLTILEQERSQRLRVSQQLETYLSVSPVMNYVLEASPDGKPKPLWVSENIEHILGFTPDEALSFEWWVTHVYPEDRQRALELSAKVLQYGYADLEYRFFHKNGSILWIRDQMRLMRRDEKNGNVEIIGTWSDITERVQSQQRIQQQLDMLSALTGQARALAESLQVENAAQETVRLACQVLGAKLAWLGRAEPDGHVTVLTVYPPEHTYPHQIGVRWDETPHGNGPTGRAIRTRTLQVVPDLLSQPNIPEWRELLLKHELYTNAAFPLISRGRVFGALTVYSDQIGFFNEERLQTFQTLAYLAAAALENARLFGQTTRRLEQISALREIDQAISNSLDLSLTLRVALKQLREQLQVDAADVLLLDPLTQQLEYAASVGFSSDEIEQIRLRVGEGPAGRAARERQLVFIPSIQEEIQQFRWGDLLQNEGFTCYYGTPLIAKGQVKGVVEAFLRRSQPLDEEAVDFFQTLAGQIAIAVDNATLFEELQRSNADLILAYDQTIEGWSRALDLRDRETEGHSQRVTELTLKIARAMGMSEEQLVHVRRGALLHDIGKMGVPDAILLKPGALNDEEWAIMRQHPTLAFQMLLPIQYLRPALDIPYCHHEKWDGTGYPRRLKGEQIPLAARIFAVVDVWDALRSDRPYRPAWSVEKTLAFIQEHAGSHFDPRVVEVFMRVIREEGEKNF